MLCYGMIRRMRFYMHEIVCNGIVFLCYAMRFQWYAMTSQCYAMTVYRNDHNLFVYDSDTGFSDSILQYKGNPHKPGKTTK